MISRAWALVREGETICLNVSDRHGIWLRARRSQIPSNTSDRIAICIEDRLQLAHASSTAAIGGR